MLLSLLAQLAGKHSQKQLILCLRVSRNDFAYWKFFGHLVNMEESCGGSQWRYYGDSYIQAKLEGKQPSYCVCTNSLASSFIRWCATGVNVDFSVLHVHFHMTVCCVPSLLLFFAHTGHLIYSPSYRAKPVRLTSFCRTQFVIIFFYQFYFWPFNESYWDPVLLWTSLTFIILRKKNVF